MSLPDHPPQAPDQVARVAAEVASRAPALRAMSMERRAAALARAAAALASPSTALGRRARASLPASTGLSPAMVEWALQRSLAPVSQRALIHALDAALAAPASASAPDSAPGPGMTLRPVVPGLVAVILAGNVFTAGLTPVLLSLGLGAPVVCKTSSRERLFADLLQQALAGADADLGRALGVVCYGGGQPEPERALLDRAGVVIVYGGDATVQQVRGRAPATARVLIHGHGVSAAYVGASALASPERARQAAAALALDTAAYDQRGCLSPVVAWVRRDQAVSAPGFALMVHQALGALERDLPRGALDPVVGAAQAQWRGVAAARGELFEGRAHAVACIDAPDSAPGPGWRNLLLRPCDGPDQVAAELGGPAWGIHLKALGLGCDVTERDRLLSLLGPPLCPRVCSLGRMQTPPLDALAGGQAPAHGLVSWLALESDVIGPAEGGARSDEAVT